MTVKLHIEQHQITEFDRLVPAFMKEMFGMDEDQFVCVTDISDLSDFTYSGMPAEDLDTSRPRKELTAIWDRWAIARVQELYGITLTTTVVNLVWLLDQIQQAKTRLVH
jgi:hypothetical protein